MVAGRPPSHCCIEMAKSLDDWSKLDTSTALVQFCNLHDTYPQKVYEWRDLSEEFAESLKKAKSRLAERLRGKLHDPVRPYNYGLFMSEIGFHDQFHHDYTESLKDSHAERTKAIAGSQQTTFNITVPHGLAAGSNISTETISTTDNKST